MIALCVWAELDYAAAAEALGVPIGTVRSRLHRARAKLRQLAAEPQPSPGPLFPATPGNLVVAADSYQVTATKQPGQPLEAPDERQRDQ